MFASPSTFTERHVRCPSRPRLLASDWVLHPHRTPGLRLVSSASPRTRRPSGLGDGQRSCPGAHAGPAALGPLPPPSPPNLCPNRSWGPHVPRASWQLQLAKGVGGLRSWGSAHAAVGFCSQLASAAFTCCVLRWRRAPRPWTRQPAWCPPRPPFGPRASSGCLSDPRWRPRPISRQADGPGETGSQVAGRLFSTVKDNSWLKPLFVFSPGIQRALSLIIPCSGWWWRGCGMRTLAFLAQTS